MKRILFSVLIILGLSVSLQAQAPCTHGTDVTPISADPAVLKPYIAGTAVDGDVICLAAGGPWTYTSSTQVDLTQGGTVAIEVRGAGTIPSPWGSAGLTKIYVESGAPFYGVKVPGSMHSPTVDNIQFSQDASSSHVAEMIDISGSNGQGGVPWIIHHNDFQWTGTCNGYGIINGTHSGVVYRNHFSAEIIVGGGCGSTNTAIEAFAQTITDDGSWWASASTLGSADTGGTSNFYIETNLFENFDVAIDANTSARVVWRFNEMHNATVSGHGYDSSTQGERTREVYNNTWVCDAALQLPGYISFRGGTHMIFNNIFPAFDVSKCGTGTAGGTSPIASQTYRLSSCGGIGGWPGSYSDTYPMAHQPGWGWINGSNQTVGASNAQDIPGLAGYPTDGFQQALEPIYIFANTNNTGNLLYYRDTGYIGTCRAMAYSNTGKTSGTTLVIPNASTQSNPYVNVGQEAVVVFSDLVGGSTPTIADSLGNTWSSPIASGTNGSQRLTAWHSHIAHAGAMVVTVTFGSSAAARAGTLIVMRGMTASPLETPPSTTNSSANPLLGTSSGALSQTNEIVLGIFGLNGPLGDGSAATAPDILATACDVCTGGYNIGLIGTTGSTDTTNTTVGVTYRAVTSTSAIQPSLTNPQTRAGVTGTIAFKVTGNDNNNLDLQVTDFIGLDREAYTEAAMFNGTSGTGSGFRTDRPASTTNGVAWWDTDHGGNWDKTNVSANDGCLDIVVSGTWSNCVYTPADYPQTLANIPGGTCTPDHLTYTDQPASALAGASLGTTAVGVYDSGNNLCTDATNTITLSKNGSATYGTLSSSSSLAKSASSGVATWTDLSINTAGSGTIDAAASGLTGTTSNSITISASCSPDHLAWIAQPSDAVLGASLGTVSVGVYDVSNVLCSSDSSTSITLSKDGSATWGTLVSGSSLTKTDSSGVATWTDLSVITTTGTGAIQSAASGLAGAGSVDITISAAPPAGSGGGLKLKLRLKGFVN